MEESSFQKLKTEITDFGVFDLYHDFVVGEWTVDHATAEQVKTLMMLFDEFYQGNAYGYIGNRVNPHSVDVASVRAVLRQAKHLKEVAFVIYSDVSKNIANIEKTFYDSHELYIHSDLETAIKWMSAEMGKFKNRELESTAS